ncbi:MAG: hypothetical protein KY457_02130 [Actinobacteria bacterium]|nr:hypothetical protein [Actinomycetota bacterium]
MSDEHTPGVYRDVRCRCGEQLVDAVVDDREVVVGEDHIPFRRTTDYLVCPACQSMYRVTDVGNELVTNAPRSTSTSHEP